MVEGAKDNFENLIKTEKALIGPVVYVGEGICSLYGFDETPDFSYPNYDLGLRNYDPRNRSSLPELVQLSAPKLIDIYVLMQIIYRSAIFSLDNTEERRRFENANNNFQGDILKTAVKLSRLVAGNGLAEVKFVPDRTVHGGKVVSDVAVVFPFGAQISDIVEESENQGIWPLFDGELRLMREGFEKEALEGHRKYGGEEWRKTVNHYNFDRHPGLIYFLCPTERNWGRMRGKDTIISPDTLINCMEKGTHAPGEVLSE